MSFGENSVLRGLNLKIVPGMTTVIVGRSGSGKSVLLKLMMGILKPDRGKVILFGRDLATVKPVELLELRKRMGMLFQNYALFDSMSVEDNVGFMLLENSRIPRRDIVKMSHELIQLLGLTGSEHLLPAELSGGMKKRVSLGRALIARPEVVLFDEPTTGLDPIMIEKVDEMILLAKEQFQITSAIISHDMASTRRLADRVAFLYDGQIAFYGTYPEFMACELPPVRTFVEGAQTSRLSRSSAVASVVPVEEVPPATDAPVVELIDVDKAFGGNKVLRGVTLPIYPRIITVLIGASGSGKSVIIKHILGLFQADRGQVKLFGQDISKLGTLELQKVRRRVGLLFQHAALLDSLTVAENVAFPLVEHSKLSRKEIHEKVHELLERLHIGDLATSMPGRDQLGPEEARRPRARDHHQARDHGLRRADDRPGPHPNPRSRRHDPGDAGAVRRHQHRDQPRHGVDLPDRPPNRAPPRGARSPSMARPPRCAPRRTSTSSTSSTPVRSSEPGVDCLLRRPRGAHRLSPCPGGDAQGECPHRPRRLRPGRPGQGRLGLPRGVARAPSGLRRGARLVPPARSHQCDAGRLQSLAERATTPRHHATE